MTFDITALSETAFYGKDRYDTKGHFAKAINSTTEAASKVWAAVLDTSKNGEVKYGSAQHFAESPFADFQVGDLLAVHTYDGREKSSYRKTPGNTRDNSVAEWVGLSYNGPALYRVTKRTAKRVTVTRYSNPSSHFSHDFDFTGETYEWNTETFGDSSARFVVNLGNAETLLAKVKETSAYARWERCKKAADAAVAEHERRRTAEDKAQKAATAAALAPHKPVAKRLNKALGFKVFTYTTEGVERTKAFEKVPTSFLLQALPTDLGDEYAEVAALINDTAVVA